MADKQGYDGGLRELSLFAGACGGILGGHLLGWRTVCAVENNAYAASVLVARQNDGILSPYPIWDDVRTFDGKPWRGIVDVVSGGFPCQDISFAGKGTGIDGARSGLWKEMARIVGEVRPRFVFVENSPALLIRGFGTVAGDLASLGYDLRWGVLGASDVGAPHRRNRIWILAHALPTGERRDKWESKVEENAMANTQRPTGDQRSQPTMQRGRPAEAEQIGLGCGSSGILPHTDRYAIQGMEQGSQQGENQRPTRLQDRKGSSQLQKPWEVEPDVGRVADGVAARVDRLRAIGNGQVPIVAATAWRCLINAA